MLRPASGRGVAVPGLTKLHQDPPGWSQGVLIGFAALSERAYPAALDALSEAMAEACSRPEPS
ncbi:hypothetical protein E1295_00485 [Nonomuraea mesophila]|uniref:Uncharacterized protein n=1 Tax=Nonomuraea mesophila TaxID=2530382 RepID=A0A4R5FXW2_9ACTN|nr:hypothetical protein [Nonomuraea mesophila]TDE60354.1 hypothetical protein E1295_00485 [Nonomuraea mesophila]